MSHPLLFAADLVAITIMTFALYFPRHRRRDMIVAYLGLNVGVLAVANALSTTGATAGVGLGLFGVLSIIRLRSAELDQAEIAYFFGSLAVGLLGGLTLTDEWVSAALMGAIVLALFVGDHPRLFAGYRVQTLTLDAAYTDEVALRRHLEHLTGGTIHRVHVRKVDLVNDTTVVETRYEVGGEHELNAHAAFVTRTADR